MKSFALAALLAFSSSLLAGSAAARSQEKPASVNFDAARPDAARRQLVWIALDEALVDVALADQTLLAGTVEAIGPDSFTLKTPAGQQVSILLSSVRSLTWVEPRKFSRGYKIKQIAEEIRDKPSAKAKVELFTRQKLSGHILETGDLSFLLIPEGSSREQTIAYREVAKLSAGSISSSPTAQDVFRTIGLVLAGIAMMPLLVLAALSG